MKTMKNRKSTKQVSKVKGAGVKRRAFTLVEVLIVISIIGILFISLVPRIDFAGDKGAMCCCAA